MERNIRRRGTGAGFDTEPRRTENVLTLLNTRQRSPRRTRCQHSPSPNTHRGTAETALHPGSQPSHSPNAALNSTLLECHIYSVGTGQGSLTPVNGQSTQDNVPLQGTLQVTTQETCIQQGLHSAALRKPSQ